MFFHPVALEPLEEREQRRIRFSTAERSIEIATGQMLTLEYDIPHDVEGIVDSGFSDDCLADTSSVR